MAASFVILLLLIVVLILEHNQEVLVVSEPSDESCLSSLYASLSRSPSLHDWTAPNFANPCNGFTSLISGATCNNGRIFKLSLPNLSLSGSLPSNGALANCTNLQSLDLSSNLLHGPIPVSISALLNLAVLNLSSNLLSGQIPPQLALCAYLNVIDLHSNRLTGPIPDQLGLLVRLSAFDVSFNQLQGPVPVTLANRTNGGGGPRFNASSFVGNRDLYGFPLPPMRRQGLSVMAIVGIGLGSGLMSLVISFTAVCIWLRVTERSAIVNGELMQQHHQGQGQGQGLGLGLGEGKISHLNMPDY